ncbi:chemotaxis protein CheW [Candidatus Dependentiae bacterium]|nr:chemotaxis protein CheW [Candidatus Dependentiae bacterium]
MKNKIISDEIIKNIKNETDSIRNTLNLTFVMNDLTSQELKVMCEISLQSEQISEVFKKYDITILERGFKSIDKMINANMFGDIQYSIALSYVLNIHEMLEEALEIFYASGTIPDDNINQINKFITMIDNFEKNKTSEEKEYSDEYEDIELAPSDLARPDQKKPEIQESQLENIDDLDGKYEYLTVENIEFINDFICETDEMLQSGEQQFLILENQPDNAEAINTVFRNIHSIKGSAGFMGLKEISKLSHTMENILDKCRNNELKINESIISVLLQSLDFLKLLLKNLQLRVKILHNQETNSELPVISISDIIKKLHAILHNKQIPDDKKEKKQKTKNTVFLDTENKPESNKESSDNTDSASLSTVKQENTEQSAKVSSVQMPSQDFQTDAIRVPIKKIDNVSEMIGELMISLSLLKQSEEIQKIKNSDTLLKLNSIELITDMLQSNILKMRMFPIKSVYDKLNRQIRDLIQKSGKKARFVTKGERTEVDKTVIDQIYAPLTHAIRNSMDHGIESPEIRISKNKCEEGTIQLSAENRGDNIVIEISDDGAGLNKKRILEKAIANKIINPNDIPSDKQIYDFIFHPGFSTAEQITEISGRGVGMDVVKKTVINLGGRIDIETEKDKGTKFIIILPLSASIIDGIIVSVGKSKFIFPILKIKHTLTPEKDSIKTVYGNNGEFIVFDNNTVPLLTLGKFYGLDYKIKNPKDSIVLIVEYDNKSFGIMVDEILYRQKVVTKSLNDDLKNICGVKTATVLGDGSVGMILEPEEIIKEFLKMK